MTLTLDDYFTYTLSFLWLILVIISINQLILEILRYRRLKRDHQNLQQPPQFHTPLHLRPTPLPTSHSISSLSHVYMENGILNVRLGNPRIVSVSSSDRDWNNPSAFIDRPPHQPDTHFPMPRFSSSPALTKCQIDKIAPINTHVNQPNHDKLTCVICLDEIHPGQPIRHLPCAHSFHAKCILIWLQRANRCPCCAKHIIPRDTEHSLPLPTVERAEPHRFLGLRDLSRTQLADRTDHGPRHHGLWSFSNRRTALAHSLRRAGFNGRRATNQSRVRNNPISSHGEHVTANALAEPGTLRSQSENGQIPEEMPGFEEMLDIDFNDGDMNRAFAGASTAQ